MIEPNDIWHLCASPLTCKTTRYNCITLLRSTPIRHFFDMHVSRVSFGQQIHSTVNRATSVKLSDTSIPEAGPCGFSWEEGS